MTGSRTRLVTGLRARRPAAGDDSGSMLMFVMVAVMGMALAALIVPMVITQTRMTKADTTRVHAVDAARAGLDVMVGRIRNSVDGGAGVSSKLPCGPLSGPVNGVGPAAYSVAISYYTADPKTTPGTPMRCVDGYGTFDPASGTYQPKFARITSTGTDGDPVNGTTRGRTLSATYVFQTTNTNIAGGRMRIFPSSPTSPEMCMDAGSGTPTAGGIIRLQACTSPSTAPQIFAYRSDLTIQLLASITPAYPQGLCLDTAPPPTAGNAVVLGVCQALGSPAYTQQWSFNDNGGYQAALPVSSTTGVLSTQCMNVANQSAGTQLLLATCDNNVTSPAQAWVPAPSVGAGAAQAPQLINYFEFGRCLDITGKNVNADHLIDYPCKQNPLTTAVAFNQQFTTPGIAAGATNATGQIYTTTGGQRYCLTSTGTDGGLVVTTVCSASNAQQVWTVYNGSPLLPYSTKYTIVDSSSRCLGLTTPYGGEQWSAIDNETCTGATEQKWNAAPNLSSSVLQDLDET